MKIIEKNYLGIIFFLFPIYLIIGIAVTEFFVMLSILIFLILNKNFEIFKDFKVIFLILFAIYIFFNALFQISDDLKNSSLVYFRFFLFALSIFYFFKINENKEHKNLYIILIFSLSLLILDSFFQFFNGKNILGMEIIKNRISSFFGDDLILGSFLLRFLPIVIWLTYYSKVKINNYTFYFTIFYSLYLITIYLSGERTSFALTILLIFLIFIFIKQLRKIFIHSSIILLIFIVVSSTLNIGKTNPSNRMFIKTYFQLTDKNLFENEQTYPLHRQPASKDHQGHFELALKIFKENKLFGLGPKGFRYYCRGVKYDPAIGICSTHPHNIIFQIASELGIIGLLFYFLASLFVILSFLKVFYKKKDKDEYNLFYLSTFALVINFFPFLTSGNFFNNWISIVIYYNIGIYFYSYQQILQNDKNLFNTIIK